MSSTTLMTFLLQTSPTTSSVSLLGSWDNFSKPYPMQKDLRTGRGHWRGCHTFENIICDGELDSIHQKRNGGLKMGGKYWYYYQLDGDTEYHNPAEPATTSCPLLPGQPLNVLDVPTQIGEGDVRARSGSTSSAVGCTMNPEDKYLNPRAAPVPMLPRLTTSQTSLHGATDHSSSPRSGRSPWSAKSGRSSPCSGSPASFGRLLSYARKASVGRVSRSLSPPTSPSRHAIFVHSPAPKSADAELESDRGRRGFNRIDRELHIGDPILISRTDESRHCVPLRVAQSAPPSRISSLRASPIEERLLVSFSAAEKPASCVQDVYPSRPQVHSRSRSQEPSPLRNAVCPKDLPIRLDITASRKGITNLDAENNKVQTPSEALSEEEPHVASLTYPVIIPEIVTGAESSPAQLVEASSKKSLPDSDINRRVNPLEGLKAHALSINADRPQLLRSQFSAWSTNTVAPSPTSTYTIDDHTSPSLSSATDNSTDPLSPCHLAAEFDTSAASELDEQLPKTEYSTKPATYLLNRAKDESNDASLNGLRIATAESPRRATWLGSSDFQGYSLPEEEHASELTPRKVPTPRFSAPLPEPAMGSQNGAERVRSWNDGSEHRLTAMEELLNDLGYLGGMIVLN